MAQNICKPFCVPIDFSFWFYTILLGWSIVENEGFTGCNFKIKVVFFFQKIIFVLANSADPDEMQHYAAFHLCLHCLPKYLFTGFWSSKG